MMKENQIRRDAIEGKDFIKKLNYLKETKMGKIATKETI